MVSQLVAVFNLADYKPLVEKLFRDEFAPKVDPFLRGTSVAQHLLFSYQDGTGPSSSAYIEGKLVCSGEADAKENPRSCTSVLLLNCGTASTPQ